MRCPTLRELPAPSKEKEGWPWTEETPPLPPTMSNQGNWPRISIITPSYNQGAYIEETIRSVLLQGYPDLEYIIIDGGSQDESLEVIRRYKQFLSYWVHEPDKGQSQAINKGFRQATGDIIAWLNSDDLYLPFSLQRVAENMWEGGEILHPIIYGDCEVIDEEGAFKEFGIGQPVTQKRLVEYWRRDWFIPQPTVFLAGFIIKGFKLDETLHYVMDWEFYLRLCAQYKFFNTRKVLARFRFGQGTKSYEKKDLFGGEHLRISRQYWEGGLRSYRYRIEYRLWPIIYWVKSAFSRGLRKMLKFFIGIINVYWHVI